MVKSSQRISQVELSSSIQTLMFLRVIFVSLLLGASIFIQIKQTQTYFGYIQTFHYLLIAIIYFLTFVYIIIYKYSKDLLGLAYLQLLMDTLFITAIIYSTGGIESIFSFLYILTIINGSIILYRKGGFIIASSSSILYGLLLDLHYYGFINPLGSRGTYPGEYQSLYPFYLILVNIIGFYLVAYLSSYLSEQARKSRVELKEKQIDIDNLEVLNQGIINSITSGLIALDGNNSIVLFNPAAEEIFGIEAKSVSRWNVEKALPFLRPYINGENFSFSQSTEKVPPFVDCPYQKTEDGETMHLRLSISPLRLSLGDQIGRILIFQDITEIRHIEEEMKRVEGLALTGELAAKIAHEIRNPMASISGSIQLLKDGIEVEDVNVRLLDIMSRETDRLNNLVNDFLMFARPKKVTLREFDLNQVILESLELFKNSQHWVESIEIYSDLQGSIHIKSDPEQIRQVLWNLILNACEAMPQGGSLYVSTEMDPDRTQENDEYVRIVVRDSGKGFNEKDLNQIFTPFFTTKEKGSGLGLAIVKGIIEGLKGQVYGENPPEGGAEIIILLPMDSQDILRADNE